MACGDYGNHSRLTNSLEPAEIPLASGQDPDETSPALVVSNAPESLDSVTQPFNLYKCEIPLTPLVAKSIRFFVWHMNTSEEATPIEFALWLSSSVADTFVEFVSIVGEVVTAEDDAGLRDAGICLAKSQLYGGAPAIDPTQEGFGTGGYLLQSASAGSGNAICWMIEATVITYDETNLRVWTAVRPSGSTYWPAYSADVCPPRNQLGGFFVGPVHVRGWWPYSRVLCIGNDTALNCCPSEFPEIVQGVVGDDSGGDTLAFAPQSTEVDPHCAYTDSGRKGNLGMYGANLVYKYFVENKCVEPGEYYGYLRTRNTGGEGKFWGAARFLVPSLEELGVEKIRYQKLGIDPTDLLNFSDLTDDGPLVVPQETTPEVEVRIELATGGAAALPINIVLSTHLLEDES